MYLLGLINSHLERTGVPESLFGRRAVGDPRFVCDLRNGRDPRPETIERVRAYIRACEREVRR